MVRFSEGGFQRNLSWDHHQPPDHAAYFALLNNLHTSHKVYPRVDMLKASVLSFVWQISAVSGQCSREVSMYAAQSTLRPHGIDHYTYLT